MRALRSERAGTGRLLVERKAKTSMNNKDQEVEGDAMREHEGGRGDVVVCS